MSGCTTPTVAVGTSCRPIERRRYHGASGPFIPVRRAVAPPVKPRGATGQDRSPNGTNPRTTEPNLFQGAHHGEDRLGDHRAHPRTGERDDGGERAARP